MSCGRRVLGYAFCVFRRRAHLLGCFWSRLLCFRASGGGRVPCLESATRQTGLGLHHKRTKTSAWCPSKAQRRGINLSDEGGLLRRDLRLCGAVVNFFGELGGRGFGLDDGGGGLVSVQGCEHSSYKSCKD
jgi:hypothetical protein